MSTSAAKNQLLILPISEASQAIFEYINQLHVEADDKNKRLGTQNRIIGEQKVMIEEYKVDNERMYKVLHTILEDLGTGYDLHFSRDLISEIQKALKIIE